MERRTFLVRGGQTMVCALTLSATKSGLRTEQKQSQDSSSTLEERVATVIQAHDAQGNHRTGTNVDNVSAEWLANQVRQMGAEPSLEPFIFSRVDPQLCYLRVDGRRIDGVPVFDASFTNAEGVHGRLGPLGSDVELGLAESEPSKLAEPGIEYRSQVSEARNSRHNAVIVLTRGARPGLFLMNASAFNKPFGPPMLQISTIFPRLRHGRTISSFRVTFATPSWWEAQRRAEATFVAQVRRTTARAFNVTVRIAGNNPTLAPLVLMAPRSGWWQCASEQGSRLACWLEALRVVAADKPARDCFFVALSGHELDLLGMDAYIKRRPDLIKGAHVWIFFGSDIGAPRQPNLIHASDDALEQWTVAAMEKEGLTVNGKARHDSMARGEAGIIQRGGGRFVTVAGGSEGYHSVADRWPEAVDVAALTRYAKAFANGALALAKQSV